MGTRSRIGVMHGDNCKSVYCHWDGYPEHNGAILQAHYDSAKANNLVALGDLSSLAASIGEKHSFDDRAACEGDRGRAWVDPWSQPLDLALQDDQSTGRYQPCGSDQ